VGLFIGNFEFKVDSKGRVSVPSTFRDSLKSGKFAGAVLYQSINNNCLEGSSYERLEKISEIIDNMDDTPEKDAYLRTILGGASQLSFDDAGRIILPDSLRKSVKITEKVVFVGKGQTFEVWEPQEYLKESNKSKELVKNKPLSIKRQ
jgi:MraZ protein